MALMIDRSVAQRYNELAARYEDFYTGERATAPANSAAVAAAADFGRAAAAFQSGCGPGSVGGGRTHADSVWGASATGVIWGHV